MLLLIRCGGGFTTHANQATTSQASPSLDRRVQYRSPPPRSAEQGRCPRRTGRRQVELFAEQKKKALPKRKALLQLAEAHSTPMLRVGRWLDVLQTASAIRSTRTPTDIIAQNVSGVNTLLPHFQKKCPAIAAIPSISQAETPYKRKILPNCTPLPCRLLAVRPNLHAPTIDVKILLLYNCRHSLWLPYCSFLGVIVYHTHHFFFKCFCSTRQVSQSKSGRFPLFPFQPFSMSHTLRFSALLCFGCFLICPCAPSCTAILL